MIAQVAPVSRVTTKLSVDDALLKEQLKEYLNNVHNNRRSKFKHTEKTGNEHLNILVLN